MKTVEGIMTTHVVCAQMDDSLLHIEHLFQSHGFHHLLVENRGELAGIISDRDFLRAISPFVGTVIEQQRDQGTFQKRAHQIMTRDVVTCPRSESISGAARKMLEHGISCLPITEDDGTTVVGLITWRDLLRHYLEHNDDTDRLATE